MVLAGSYLALMALLLSRWAGPHAAVERRLAAHALLVFVLLDLSSYFFTATRADMEFMLRRGFQGTVPTAEARARFRTPWAMPDLTKGFDGGIAAFMPLRNDFWPNNTFMLPAGLTRAEIPEVLRLVEEGQPFATHDAAVTYQWRRWEYNAYEVEIQMPAAGPLLARQLFDHNWRFSVDGRPATASPAKPIGTIIPMDRGGHLLHAEYRPTARRLYFGVTALLELACAALLLLARTKKTSRRARR
jgi:hypothetical protein